MKEKSVAEGGDSSSRVGLAALLDRLLVLLMLAILLTLSWPMAVMIYQHFHAQSPRTAPEPAIHAPRPCPKQDNDIAFSQATFPERKVAFCYTETKAEAEKGEQAA